MFLLYTCNVLASAGDTIYVSRKNDLSKRLSSEGYHIIKVDEAPKFKGGQSKMNEYVSKNLRYPNSINEDSLTSKTVDLKFIVNVNGKVEDVAVTEGLTPDLDKEAIRVISSLPKMIPGRKEGKRVATLHTYRLRFMKVKLGPEYIDKKPCFIGGENAMAQYINENLKYPAAAQYMKKEGRVVVRFTIDTAGKVKNVRTVESFDKSCDIEAKRVVAAMPNWEPALFEGQLADCEYTLPIVFRLKKNVDDNELSISDKTRNVRSYNKYSQ